MSSLADSASTITIEVTNGVIVLGTGIILFILGQVWRWVHQVNRRLGAIEDQLKIPNPSEASDE